jgi:hypothetical protein
VLRSVAGILVLVACAGLLIGCQAGGGSALRVGDCINFQNNDEGTNTVRVDCAQPHDQEVFNTFVMPGETFPGYYEIGDAQQDECRSAFEDYVGVPWTQSVYTIDYAGPTEETWAAGDHTIVCALEDARGAKLTGSAKNTAH